MLLDTRPVASGRGKVTRSVLLIDDDRETAAATRQVLEQIRVSVRAVPDGRVAVTEMAREAPDAIVVELGSMTGREVIDAVKTTSQWGTIAIPIIMYSRMPVLSQIEAHVFHGADAFVSKDAGPAVLAEHLLALLDQ